MRIAWQQKTSRYFGKGRSVMQRPSAKRGSLRRGSLLVESALSAVIIATVIISVAQLLALSARQQRQTQQRQLALETAANLLDQAYALPWDELDTAHVSALQLPNEVERQLPGVTLQASVVEAPGSATTEPLDRQTVRRLEIRVSWFPTVQSPSETVQLRAWRFARTPSASPALSAPAPPAVTAIRAEKMTGTNRVVADGGLLSHDWTGVNLRREMVP